MLKQKAKINGLTRWNGEFVDKVTKEVTRGTPFTKLYYVSENEVISENKVGNFEGQYKGEFKLFDQLKHEKFPIYVELDFELRPDGKGSPQVWIVGVQKSVNQKTA